MNYRNFIKNKKGAVIGWAIVFGVIIFTVAAMLTTLMLASRVSTKTAQKQFARQGDLDQIGEYFIRCVNRTETFPSGDESDFSNYTWLDENGRNFFKQCQEEYNYRYETRTKIYESDNFFDFYQTTGYLRALYVKSGEKTVLRVVVNEKLNFEDGAYPSSTFKILDWSTGDRIDDSEFFGESAAEDENYLLSILKKIWQLIGQIFFGAGETSSTCTVTYKSDVDAQLPQTVSYPEGQKIIIPAAYKAGYEFLGWRSGSKDFAAGEEYEVVGNITFNARLEPFTTTLHCLGGSGANAGSDNITATGIIETLPSAGTKSGFVFVGWSVTEGGKVKYKEGVKFTPTDECHELWAVWASDSYTITYSGSVKNGSDYIQQKYKDISVKIDCPTDNYIRQNTTFEDDYAVIKFSSNGEIVGSSNVSAEVTQGYAFLGWSESDTAKEPEYAYGDSIPAEVNRDLTLYPVYTENGEPQVTGIEFEIPDAPSNGPVGKEFQYWLINGEELTEDYVPTEKEETAVAVWGNQNIPVEIVSKEGGSVDDAKNSITVEYGTTVTQQGNALIFTDSEGVVVHTVTVTAIKGYTFDSWADCPETITAHTVIYAQWKYEFKVTYNANGGSTTATSPTTVIGIVGSTETTKITLPTATRDYYTLNGWKDGGTDGKTYAAGAEYPITKNTDFVASWTPIQYTISYQNVDSIGSNPTTYTVESDTITLTAPTRNGYNFKGWQQLTNIIPKGSHGNKVFTALWEPIEYTITYNLVKDGAEQYLPTLKYTIETESFVIVNPTHTNYSFIGWTGTNLSKNTIKVNIPKGSTGDRTYTANWTATQYTITYKHRNYEDETKISSVTNSNPTTYTIESDTIYLTEPTKSGWRFIGWTGNGIKTPTKLVTIQSGSTGNKQFYAWFVKLYYIKFSVASDVTLEGTSPIVYAKGETIDQFPIATRPGYTFRYWYDSYTKTVDETTNQTTTTYHEFKWEDVDTNNPPTNKDSSSSLTLGARWKAIKYNINYNLNGGINSSKNPTTYTIASDSFTLIAPTKAGYIFAGWTYDDVTTPTKTVTIEKGTMGAKTFTAHWTAIPYTITYNLDGGTNNSANPATYTADDADITLKAPTKSYYDFNGWSGTGIEGTSTAPTIANGSTGDRTYTANWSKSLYKIYFNLAGGKYQKDSYSEATTTIDFARAYIGEAPTLPTESQMKRSGYRFVGWYNGSTQITEDYLSNNPSEMTLTAKWNVKVTLNANGGTMSASTNVEFAEGATYTLPTAVTKTGLTFAGWYDGSTKITTATIDKSYAGKTLTAKWSYTVTLNPNGGTYDGKTTNSTVTLFEGETKTLTAPSRTNCTFDGWYNGTTKVTTIDSSYNGKTLTAKWKYTVTFNPNGGKYNNSTNTFTLTFTVGETAALPFVTRDKCTLDGWYNGTTKVTSLSVSNAGQTLTAKWKYTVTFNPNGGKYNNSTNTFTLTFTVGETASLPTNPTRTNCTFDGWYNGTTKVTSLSVSNADQTLIAKWTYEVTFNPNGGKYNKSTNTFTLTFKTGETAEFPTVTRNKYTFEKWTYKASTYGTAVTVTEITVDYAGKTLTANWLSGTYYRVTLDPNGGSYNGSTSPSEYLGKDNTALPTTVTRSGYTFVGWYYGTTKVEKVTSAYNGKTLTASWKVKRTLNVTITNATATVTCNGQTLNESGSIDAYDGAEVTITVSKFTRNNNKTIKFNNQTVGNNKTGTHTKTMPDSDTTLIIKSGN